MGNGEHTLYYEINFCQKYIQETENPMGKMGVSFLPLWSETKHDWRCMLRKYSKIDPIFHFWCSKRKGLARRKFHWIVDLQHRRTFFLLEKSANNDLSKRQTLWSTCYLMEKNTTFSRNTERWCVNRRRQTHRT